MAKLTRGEFKSLRYKAICVWLAALSKIDKKASRGNILGNVNESIRNAVKDGYLDKVPEGYQPSKKMIDLWDATFKEQYPKAGDPGPAELTRVLNEPFKRKRRAF
jgi:hypothetical protein